MTKSIISRPGSNKSQSNFVPNNFLEIQQREPLDVRYNPAEISHFFQSNNPDITFDRQEEMKLEQFTNNLKEVEEELRLLREAAQAGNPFAKRELFNGELQHQIRIQNEIELKKTKELEEKRIKTSIQEFEKANRDSIEHYYDDLTELLNNVCSLSDEIRKLEYKSFEHCQRVWQLREECQKIYTKYKDITSFISTNKNNLKFSEILDEVFCKREMITKLLYESKTTIDLTCHFNSEINFRETLTQLMTLQKEFIETQVRYKAFPICPNPNVIEMPRQISQIDPFLNVYVTTVDSVPVQKVIPSKRVIC